MAEITKETIFARAQDLMSNQIDNEVVMMHFERGTYYGLDEIGSDIWNRLELPMRVGDLCAQLTEDYDVEPAVCSADVIALLAQMEAEELVNRV